MIKNTICGALIVTLILVTTISASAQKTEIAPVGQNVVKPDLKSLLEAETVRLKASSEATATTAASDNSAAAHPRPRRNYASRNKTIMWLGIASALSTLLLVLTTRGNSVSGYTTIPDCRTGPC